MPQNRIHKEGLSKKEKLKSEKTISSLFEKGKSIKAYPLKLLYIEKTVEPGSDYPLLFSVSVSKRLIKTAVNRNRIKRLIREAYRINCLSLKKKASAAGKQFSFMFIYIHKEMPDYNHVKGKTINILEKLENSF